MSDRITRESFRSAFLAERERLRQKQIPIDAADVMALLEPLFVEREKSEALHCRLIAATEVVTQCGPGEEPWDLLCEAMVDCQVVVPADVLAEARKVIATGLDWWTTVRAWW